MKRIAVYLIVAIFILIAVINIIGAPELSSPDGWGFEFIARKAFGFIVGYAAICVIKCNKEYFGEEFIDETNN